MSFRNKKKQKFRNFNAYERLDKLDEAIFLIESEDWFAAFVFLQEATQKYPSEIRFWEQLAVVASELGEVPTIQKSFEKLTRFQPNNSDAWFGLASAYGMGSQMALSFRGFREFLKRFPEDENNEKAAEIMKAAENDLHPYLAEFDFPEGEEGIELACLHEEVQVLLNRNEFEEAVKKAEQLINRMPDFTPAYNNLSLILFMSGEAEKAVETARKVLEKQPENFHALSNLVKFSVFLGKPDEARQFAAQLLQVKNNKPDLWIKKVEAFTFVGDDKTVAEIYNAAGKNSEFAVPENFAKHLAAFAFYQLGKQNQARKIWQEILSDDPYFEFAIQNLDELDLPENHRNIFALPVNYWIPAKFTDDLMKDIGKIKGGRHFEKELQKKSAQFFAKNPNILHVLSILLERSNEAAKELAIILMSWAATPESFATLKEFAFGQKGSDKIRYHAAMKLSEADVIPRKVRLWQNGEWQEMLLMTYEVTGEPIDVYPIKPKAKELLKKGLDATQKQNVDLAGQYYQMALEANGEEHPSILYNLLAIKQMQGAKLLDLKPELREMVRKFPEYPFSAIALATSEVKNGNLEAAKNLTERLIEKKRWHITEMSAWLYYNLEMALAEKHFDSARMSLAMLQDLDENLDYEYWDTLISGKKLINKISGIPSRLFGRRSNRQ